jgi:hypothetical protein
MLKQELVQRKQQVVQYIGCKMKNPFNTHKKAEDNTITELLAEINSDNRDSLHARNASDYSFLNEVSYEG